MRACISACVTYLCLERTFVLKSDLLARARLKEISIFSYWACIVKWLEIDIWPLAPQVSQFDAGSKPVRNPRCFVFVLFFFQLKSPQITMLAHHLNNSYRVKSCTQNTPCERSVPESQTVGGHSRIHLHEHRQLHQLPTAQVLLRFWLNTHEFLLYILWIWRADWGWEALVHIQTGTVQSV